MFTGLIGDLGSVVAVEQEGDGATLRIASTLADEMRTGDSISVNGVCLTATAVSERGFCAQAIHETLERSSLGRLHAGSRVNLELALRAEDRLGGHAVNPALQCVLSRIPALSLAESYERGEAYEYGAAFLQQLPRATVCFVVELRDQHLIALLHGTRESARQCKRQ